MLGWHFDIAFWGNYVWLTWCPIEIAKISDSQGRLESPSYQTPALFAEDCYLGGFAW